MLSLHPDEKRSNCLGLVALKLFGKKSRCVCH